MFVVMRIQKFDFEQKPDDSVHIGLPIKVDSGKMVGYLPVYETREDAHSDFPDAGLVMVRLIE